MSGNSKIGWTDQTWNPLIGCEWVSPGCDRCYAIIQSRIRSFNPNPAIAGAFAGLVMEAGQGLAWTGQVNLLEARLAWPLHWVKPRRVFVNSLSDLFYAKVPGWFIARVFAVMALTPHITYQLLTKRHGRLRALLNSPSFAAEYTRAYHDIATGLRARGNARQRRLAAQPCPPLPLPNLWIGVSAENQAEAEKRIPALLATPAAVHWVSAEPLIGPVGLRHLKTRQGRTIDALTGEIRNSDGSLHAVTAATLDWVVPGGESGSGARPMHPDWLRSLRDQCAATGTALFVKQWGEWGPAQWRVASRPGESTEDYRARAGAAGATHAARTLRGGLVLAEATAPAWSADREPLPAGDAGIRRWGRNRTGHELDGQEWRQFPRPLVAA